MHTFALKYDSMFTLDKCSLDCNCNPVWQPCSGEDTVLMGKGRGQGLVARDSGTRHEGSFVRRSFLYHSEKREERKKERKKEKGGEREGRGKGKNKEDSAGKKREKLLMKCHFRNVVFNLLTLLQK